MADALPSVPQSRRPRMQLEIADIVKSSRFTARWALPPIDPAVQPASLTNLLPTIPEVERALLPQSRSALTDINRTLASRPFVAACATTSVTRAHSRVALAVDRAALFLSGHDIARRPEAWLRRIGERGQPMASVLQAWRPGARGLFNNRAAIAWLYVLGGLDVAQRRFVPLADVITSPLPRCIDRSSVQAWFADLLAPDIADEIVRLLRSLKEIRILGKVHPNPVFGGIGPIMGSDGDWIVDDTLVELKCVVGGVKRCHVAQLVCYYALSQLPDRVAELPPFSRLALCLPRQSATIIGTVNEWLYAFGAPSREVVVKALHECLDPAGERFRPRQTKSAIGSCSVPLRPATGIPPGIS
jgi:hypothetical protein